MSVASEITRLQGAKADLKTSIEAKGVTVPSATTIDGYAALIDQIQTGSGGNPEAEENDVIFIDYDGTIRYSYSAADFANLTELPANPTHQGLTAQGWNWTLADAKEYVAAYGMLVIGQNYITDDGKTRLYLTIGEQIKTITLYWQQSVSNGVTINWGDGSTEETVSGTDGVSLAHTYAAHGDYRITMNCTSGTILLGYGSQIGSLFGDCRTNLGLSNSGALGLYKIELGNNMVKLCSYVCSGYRGLCSITCPNSLKYVQANAFDRAPVTGFVLGGEYQAGYNFVEPTFGYTYCKYVSVPKFASSIGYGSFNYRDNLSLRMITLGEGTTQMRQSTFYNCYNLKRIAIPEQVTDWSQPTTFMNCISLEEITVPSGVTSIGSRYFDTCTALKKIVMKSTTPPTISANTFQNTRTDLVIYVPYSSDHSVLTAYQTATNWSTYASQMVEMPA